MSIQPERPQKFEAASVLKQLKKPEQTENEALQSYPPPAAIPEPPPPEEPRPETSAPDIAALTASARLDYTQRIEKPPLALTIDGETFGTLGNFSVLKGKAKSRKSFASTLLMTAGLGKQIGGIKGHLPPDKSRVVLFDTEQSEYHVNKMANRVTKLYGAAGVVEHFDVYKLREQGTENRLAIIEHVLATTPDIGLAVIDGVRDIVKSINDETEATAIADTLMRWTTIYNCHIITVLHQNKGNNQLRGHIGTELQNKAEAVANIERDQTNKEVSLFSASEIRDKEFEQFAFMISGGPGELALPEIINYTPPDPEKSRGAKTTPEELTDIKHAEIIRYIEKHAGEEPPRSEVLNQIKAAYRSTQKETLSDNRSKDWLTYYLNNGYIIRHGKDRTVRGKEKRYYSFQARPPELM